MIGMAVGAVGRERQDDLRPQAADFARDGRDGLRGIGPVQVLVDVIEHREVADAERRRRGPQFLLANPRERVRAGMLRRIAMPAEPAALAARRGDERRLDAFGRIPRQRAPDAERLIIGMGEHRQQSQGHGRL